MTLPQIFTIFKTLDLEERSDQIQYAVMSAKAAHAPKEINKDIKELNAQSASLNGGAKQTEDGMHKIAQALGARIVHE